LQRTKKRKSSLQRLQRWRRRWNVRIGSIAERSALPVADRRRKVRRISSGSVFLLVSRETSCVRMCMLARSCSSPAQFFGGRLVTPDLGSLVRNAI
jgi:hypothetical protein